MSIAACSVRLGAAGAASWVALLVNWAVKLLSMALLDWLFIPHGACAWLRVDLLGSYFPGLIALAAAPCTAIAFAWSGLTGGDPAFTLQQATFALVAPIILAQIWRHALLRRGQATFESALTIIGPFSITALQLTLSDAACFPCPGFFLRQPLVIVILSAPILMETFIDCGLACWLNRRLGQQRNNRLPLGADQLRATFFLHWPPLPLSACAALNAALRWRRCGRRASSQRIA